MTWRTQLAWPAGRSLDPSELPRWIAQLGEEVRERGADELAELAAAVVQDPLGPDKLYDLGYALIDAGAPEVAATILWRCLALVGDSEEVVCELVSALESALAYDDAFAILDAHAALRARSFLCAYLYAFNAAMVGRLDIVRAQLPELQPSAPEMDVMRETIARIVERADRVTPADALDLRGWHYVLTGGLLQHLSPYGFDEPMHGRYAMLNDSPGYVAFGLDRLASLVAGLALPCIYAPPGPNHDQLAAVASERLGIPLAPWPAVGTPAPGLVVAYDLAHVDRGDLALLAQRREGQIFYAHACPWTHDSPVAPDVTMLLYQVLYPAWEQPAAVEIDLSTDQPEQWSALVARAWPPDPGPRARLWAGGPVPSNRFV